MRPGPLRHRVAIDRNTPVQDSSGDPVADWNEIGQSWASIEPLTGREGDVDRSVMAEIDTRIRLRYSPLTVGLTPFDRIRYDNRVYNVVSTFDVALEHVEVRVLAKSGLNDG